MTATFSFAEIDGNRGKLRASVHRTAESGGVWVIFCHGLTGMRLGPHYLYVRISRALETMGISSLRFDFGGSGESDGAFHGMTVRTMREDLLTVIGWMRGRFNPAKLVLLGHSLGGCVAAMALDSAAVDGMVLLAPIADPLGIKRRREQIIAGGPNAAGFYENGPHEMSMSFLDALQGADPVAVMAGRLKGPLLLFQGDADPSVAVGESQRFIDAAAKSGLRATHRILAGVDHNFSTVAAVNTLCDVIPRWIKETVA